MHSKEASCNCPESSKKKCGLKRVNQWQVFLKEFREENKELYKGKSGVEVVKLASVAYKSKKNEGNTK